MTVEPVFVFGDGGLKEGPCRAADEFLGRSVEYLRVEPLNEHAAAIRPALNIFPHDWSTFSLFWKEIDAFVQFPHSLCNLPTHFFISYILRRQCPSVEEFLESPIRKCTEQSWADVLLSQATKNGELSLTVDKVVNLCSVNPEQELLRRTSWFRCIVIGVVKAMW